MWRAGFVEVTQCRQKLRQDIANHDALAQPFARLFQDLGQGPALGSLEDDGEARLIGALRRKHPIDDHRQQVLVQPAAQSLQRFRPVGNAGIAYQGE